MQILRIFIFLIISFTSVYSNTYCHPDYNCTIVVDEVNGQASDLKCRLSNMKSFPILAKNVLTNDNNLRQYFGFASNTVCDILGWMDTSVEYLDNFQGLNKNISTLLTLKVSHLHGHMGGSTSDTSITLDSVSSAVLK